MPLVRDAVSWLLRISGSAVSRDSRSSAASVSLPLFFGSGVVPFHVVNSCTSLTFPFPGAIFCATLSLSVFPPISLVVPWTPSSIIMSMDCPLCVQPSGHPSHYPLLLPATPTFWTSLLAGGLWWPSPFSSMAPLALLGRKMAPITLSTLWAGSCHTLGCRGDLLLALMPPSTPLPPHPREGADRSPGPPHSRQVPDRGVWGGWRRAPSRALRLHLCLWGRLPRGDGAWPCPVCGDSPLGSRKSKKLLFHS